MTAHKTDAMLVASLLKRKGAVVAENALLKIAEAARILSVSRRTVYSLIDSGALVRVKIGRAARVTAKSVDAIASGGKNVRKK